MKNPIIDRDLMYNAHNYSPLPIVLVKGEGIYLWDDAGNRYIDMMSAYSAVSHGHCHPRLVRALQEQSTQLNIVSRAFYSDKLGPFSQKICELSGFQKALVMNSGAEAVETALKAARKWAYTVKGVPVDEAEIIVCQNNFHGRTISIISMSTESQYKFGFGPLTPGFKVVPFGDAAALEKAITPNTAAFLVEPIQGEAGIIIPEDGYLKKCAEICSKHNVLLICDEIQTGLGRTGKLFAHQYDAIKPDALILGKALGGGLLPISVFLSQEEVMDVFTPGDHGSTFGGNPLAASVGSAAIDVLLEDNLAQKAADSGKYLLQQLKQIQSSMIKEIRGKGLLIGIELHAGNSARKICLRLLKHGILTKETHETVIRIAPPLIITKEQIDSALLAIQKVFDEVEENIT